MVYISGWYRGILTKGLTATIGRNGVFNMVYFGFYHSVKDVVPVFSDPTAEFCKKVHCIRLQIRTWYNNISYFSFLWQSCNDNEYFSLHSG